MYFLLLLLACATCLNASPQSETPASKVNYPSTFQVARGFTFFAQGEALYWSAQEDGLYYAQKANSSWTGQLPPSSGTAFKGHLKKLDPTYTTGLRVGLGFFCPHSGFDALLTWTSFTSHLKDHAHGSLLPLWGSPTAVTQASSAAGKWNLSLNTLDLEGGRGSWFGGNFSLRPFIALRAAHIGQCLHTRFTYLTTPETSTQLHARSSFTGMGLRAGADTRFTLPYGFSLWGLASASLLYGALNGKASTHAGPQTIASTRDKPHTALSSAQLALGCGWDSHFKQERLHLALHLGWEENLWFSLNQMNHFVNTLQKGLFFKEKGTLSTQGLTVGGRLSF